MGFHPEGLGGTVADRRAVGWCQFGTPDELPNIRNAKAYDEELASRGPP